MKVSGSDHKQNTVTDLLELSNMLIFPPGQGNAAPTGNCTAGWYCSGGADRPNTTTNGGECNMGFYCPEGTANNHVIRKYFDTMHGLTRVLNSFIY